MSEALSSLEASLTELRNLREFKEEAEKIIEDLTKQLGYSTGTVKNLRAKCDVLEKRPCVLDGVDEDFLFENRCHVRFDRHVNGGLLIRIRDGKNQTLARLRGDEGPDAPSLLGAALEKASGRSRSRTKK